MKWHGLKATAACLRMWQRWGLTSSTSHNFTVKSLRSSTRSRKCAAHPGRGVMLSTTPTCTCGAPSPAPASPCNISTPRMPPGRNDGSAFTPSGRGSNTLSRIWRLSPGDASRSLGLRSKPLHARCSSYARSSCVAGGSVGARFRLSDPSRVGSKTASSAHGSLRPGRSAWRLKSVAEPSTAKWRTPSRRSSDEYWRKNALSDVSNAAIGLWLLTMACSWVSLREHTCTAISSHASVGRPPSFVLGICRCLNHHFTHRSVSVTNGATTGGGAVGRGAAPTR
mmetsp:Transcript_100773/g.308101  ORF Transcript_100773/g.308101 Transcript_100773/m.308101 type:complete len:281 (+) Transcript_100773:300-1142(+)